MRYRTDWKEEEETFDIPPNVKVGKVFLNLTLAGWLWMIALGSMIGLAGWGFYTLTGQTKWTVWIFGSLIGTLYYLLMIDEKTGTYNGVLIRDIWKWMRSDKVLHLWERNEDDLRSLQIEVESAEKAPTAPAGSEPGDPDERPQIQNDLESERLPQC